MLSSTLHKTGQGTISSEEQLKSYSMQEVYLKFLLTGLLSGLPLPPFAIRMCPALTTKNIKQYQPLLAVGKCLKQQSAVYYFSEILKWGFWLGQQPLVVLPRFKVIKRALGRGQNNAERG